MRKGIFVLLFSTTSAVAQTTGFSVWTGVGTFQMSSQVEFQQALESVAGLPVDLEPVYSFPPYWLFGAGLVAKVSERSAIGFWYEYTSTGGRLSYKDYSATISLDQLLSVNHYGVQYQHRINHHPDWQFFVTGQVSAAFTQGTVRSSLVMGATQQSEELSISSINFGIRPGVMVQRKWVGINWQAAAGYEFQHHGVLETSDGVVLSGSGGDVTAEWDGLRFRIGVFVPVGAKSKGTKP